MVDRSVLEALIKEIISEQLPAPTPQPSRWDRFKKALSEQGTQRGLFALVPLISYQLGIPIEGVVAILAFSLGMIGVNNIVTPG